MPGNQHNELEKLRKLGKEKREQKELQKAIAKKKQQKQAASNRQISDQQRVFLHITRWHGLFKTMKMMSFVIGPSIVIMAFTTYAIITIHEEPIMNQNVMVKGLLGLITIIAIILFARNMRNKAVVKEVDWINSLPFQLIAFPDFLVYRSYPSFWVTIQFADKTPTKEFVLDLLSSLPYEVTYDGEEEHPFKYEVNNSRGSKFNRHRRWAYRWVHQACDNQLQALHKSNPIQSVTIGDGTKELNFDWWVPLKKNSWWQHWI